LYAPIPIKSMCKLDTHADNISEDNIWTILGKMSMLLC